MKNNGITLTELLVACILIGIVMIGVASFSIAVQSLHSSTNKAAILAMRTITAMNRISKDAYLAIGDSSSAANRGVDYQINGNRRSICFRHDTDNDPSSYGGDTWVCYYVHPNGNLWYCGTNATRPLLSQTDCWNGEQESLLQLADRDFARVVNLPGAGPFEYVDISLESIFDPSLTAHPLTNPTYTIQTRIHPPGHSG